MLRKNELTQIIEKLESSNSKDQAYFGIYFEDGVPTKSYISGNRQGLELFAALLLKASRDTVQILKTEDEVTLVDYTEDWIKGSTFVRFIQPFLKSRATLEDEYDLDDADKDFLDDTNDDFSPQIGRLSDEYEEDDDDDFDTNYSNFPRYGCLTLFVILLFSAVIGLITLVKWIFQLF